MPIDLFQTRRMIRALEQMKPPKRFLLNTFFGSTETHDTTDVDIDIVKGTRRMAPFVHPQHQGKLIERAGYSTHTYKPPYIKEKVVTTAQMLLNRQPGEMVYQGSLSPEQRAAVQLGKDLAELEEMIVRREEWMAAQALFTGQVHVVGGGLDAVIDFLMGAEHKVVLSAGDLWNESTSDPLADLRKWRRMVIQDSGVSPNVAVFGSSVIDAFLDHDGVKSTLDTRRIDMGQIKPEVLPDGVTYYGYIRDVALDIYGYDEWFLDDAGDEQPMVPVNKVLIGSTNARATRHYGMIQDMEAQANFAVARYPKSWTEKDPGVRFLLLQSAPLVVPHQIDAFLVATVLA